MFAPELSHATERLLLSLGVRSRNGVKVVGVDENGVVIESDGGKRERIETKTALWAAGVTASSSVASQPASSRPNATGARATAVRR